MLLFTTFTLFSLYSFVLADPTPSAPGPGDSFNEGTNCSFSWSGDSNASSTVWKTMNVELMSGSNFAMVHLTTVTSNLDGTAGGSHSFPCPQVTPNSPIYFYQFSSPQSPNITWTTRFTIADASGKSTPAAEQKQPNSGDPVPWGTGALVDPTVAVAAPSIGGSNANAAPSTPSASITTSSTPPSSPTPSAVPSTSPAASSALPSAASTNTTGAGSAAPSSSVPTSSDAVGLSADTRWQALAALVATAVAFAVLL